MRCCGTRPRAAASSAAAGGWSSTSAGDDAVLPGRIRGVVRSLVEGLSWGSGWPRRWLVPSKPAISLARTRLGVAPLAALFARGFVPLATAGTPGAFSRGRRLMSIDGTALDLTELPATCRVRPARHRPGGGSAFAAAAGRLGRGRRARDGRRHRRVHGRGTDAGPRPGRRVPPGDAGAGRRGFTAFPLWAAAAATGADCSGSQEQRMLPVLERYGDGVPRPSRRLRGQTGPGPTCCPCGWSNAPRRPGPPPGRGHPLRLLTTIADPTAAPAAELAALYLDRWESKPAWTSSKPTSAGRGSSSLQGPRWGAPRGLRLPVHPLRDPRPHAHRRHRPRRRPRPGFPPPPAPGPPQRPAQRHATRTLAVALPHTIAEINRRLLPPRRLRANPRVSNSR